MDQPDFDLLLEHIRAQEDRLRRFLNGIRTQGRGTAFVRLANLHLGGAETLRKTLQKQFGSASDPVALAAVERKAVRLVESLDDLHVWIVHFAGDVDRRDIPVGLLYLIDALLGVVAPGANDALVHIDDNYMYSVISPVKPLADLFDTRIVAYTEPVRPVILNLPGSDPTNVLLSPILAHEVGHPTVVEKNLLDEFNRTVDKSHIQPIWDACLALGADPATLREILSSWVSELLCDAFAVATTGPSMLYASLAFLPGPLAGRFGKSHPDPAHRIALTISWLKDLGWGDWLESRTPDVFAWSISLSQVSANPSVLPELMTLTDAVPHCSEAIWSIVKTLVGQHIFTPEMYEGYEVEAIALLARQIPLVEIDGDPIPPWVIVLATWTHAIVSRGGSPYSISQAVSDAHQSATALKAIELSTVLRLWRDDGSSPT